MSIGNLNMLLGTTAYLSSYSISSSAASINEGNTVTVTVSARVPDSTTVGYTVTGVNAEDLSRSTTGTFTLTSNQGILDFPTLINDDMEIFLAVEPLSGSNLSVVKYRTTADLQSPVLEGQYFYPVGSSQRASSIFFKPDGEKFWLLDNNNDEIAEFSMTPEPSVDQWDLSTVVAGPVDPYSTLGTNHQGLWISSSGTQLFQTDRALSRIIQDTITAWNPTFSLGPQSPERTLDISATASLPTGIHVKPDGTKAFVADVSNPTLGSPGAILAYSGTAFQCNTWTFSTSLAVGYFPLDVRVNDTGTKMYTVGDNRIIYYYTLSTPWDLSTATLVSSLNLSASYSLIQGIYIANPASETFRLTLDATDSIGNQTGSKFVDVVINDYVTPGFQLFSTPGTTTFTVPNDVTSVNVVAIGGGGGGQISRGTSGGGEVPASGGGGGGLGWKNNIAVTPGSTYTVLVGQGGAGATIVGDQLSTTVNGSPGFDSYFISSGTVKGGFGGGGDSDGGSAGTFTGDGGGNGGVGQTRSSGYDGGGGGGAGGYSGNGGGATSGQGNNPATNSGGGGAGASREYSPDISGGFISEGGDGGGVGAHGKGSDGVGGGATQISGGTTAPSGTAGSFGSSQTYGGGGGGAMYAYFDSGATRTASSGSPGAVLIRWGTGTTFPDYKNPASY
jgi:hypothetical protein